ncbi:hypothetical protein Taro_005125, partial [Colocasia esculenta]|nr:hypothetical protein [Colocasia esculenta]
CRLVKAEHTTKSMNMNIIKKESLQIIQQAKKGGRKLNPNQWRWKLAVLNQGKNLPRGVSQAIDGINNNQGVALNENMSLQILSPLNSFENAYSFNHHRLSPLKYQILSYLDHTQPESTS